MADTLTPESFTAFCLAMLSREFPQQQFRVQEPLTIVSGPSGEITHYLHNHYSAYQSSPEELEEIMHRLSASVSDLLHPREGTPDLSRIMPVIKSAGWVNQLKEMTPPVLLAGGEIAEGLAMILAEDRENSVQYLSREEVKELGMEFETLYEQSLQNLIHEVGENIQRHGGPDCYMLTAGGTYESSLILLAGILTKENFPVQGDIVIGVPNRDMLLVTGSEQMEGIRILRETVEKTFSTGNYSLSPDLYRFQGGRFELFV